MKLSWRLYRCVSIPRTWFSSLLGLPVDTAPAKLEEKLRQEFGPFAPRINLWWSEHVVVGIECQAYDLTEQKIPCGGLCSADPMIAQDVDRVDGALESELNRWGITTEFKDFEWKSSYALTGQGEGA